MTVLIALTLRPAKDLSITLASPMGETEEVRQDIADSTSFGFSMIHTFADQLDGTLQFKSEQCTKVSLTLN